MSDEQYQVESETIWMNHHRFVHFLLDWWSRVSNAQKGG